MSMKFIDIQKFVDDGYLQEVNRQFFHPLGMALTVSISTPGGEVGLFGIQETDDQEGIIFEDFDEGSLTKAGAVLKEAVKRAGVRQKTLGFVIQPIKVKP